MHVVSRVKGIGQNYDNIVLDHLITDQVHLFARNIGVPNLGLKNKFICHLAIASHFEPASTLKFWFVSHCTGKPINSKHLQGCQCHL